jgi:hypothetical protein
MFPFDVHVYFSSEAAVGISELRDLFLEYSLTKVKAAGVLRGKCNVEFFMSLSWGKYGCR